MRKNCTPGSVRGAARKGGSYRGGDTGASLRCLAPPFTSSSAPLPRWSFFWSSLGGRGREVFLHPFLFCSLASRAHCSRTSSPHGRPPWYSYYTVQQQQLSAGMTASPQRTILPELPVDDRCSVAQPHAPLGRAASVARDSNIGVARRWAARWASVR